MAFVSSEAFCEITTKLRKTGELSDGRIILDDGSEFKIHKILLATGSGYFNMLFSWHKHQKDFPERAGLQRSDGTDFELDLLPQA